MHHPDPTLTYPQAIITGLIQGVTELFPVSSLGHNVLLPAIVGGSWETDLNVAANGSPYLAFVVGLHVATAIGIMIYFWRDWVRIVRGFFSSIRHRRVQTVDEKLCWFLIIATIPVGLVGLLFEHEFRELFAKPIRAAIFLVVNGVILYAGERFRTRRSKQADADQAARRAELAAVPSGGGAFAEAGAPGTPRRPVAAHASGHRAIRRQEELQALESDVRLSDTGFVEAVIIGSAQILALLAGISRDGVTMVAGMFRGLSREDAARFAFLLATPVILAAGVLKLPDLTGPDSHGIQGQILVGSILSGIGAYLSVRFLVRYFQTRTLTPFAVYCVVAGLAAIVYLQLR
ncbi:MAG TPA: undecaprenyl-diphosphate phosphatase [Streptosporangiaceae bacterium]|nr:undecaprenyl-diphosphate phosphatase [Streptosporangiaceae bacterium]